MTICVVDASQAIFHAIFTWLTFRMFDVLLVYVSTLASAVGAVLPLVPVWLIALPAAAQLALQACFRTLDAHRDDFLKWVSRMPVRCPHVERPGTCSAYRRNVYVSGLPAAGGIS